MPHALLNPMSPVEQLRASLDASHARIEGVIDRILDLTAAPANGEAGPYQAFCLLAPPGHGKSSLSRSIANGLKRPFSRIPLGGISDAAAIHGDRRSTPGGSSGAIMNAVRRAGDANPVVLLDGIDKLDVRSPAAVYALLEALDPDSRAAFHDNYLGADSDLSQVLFIATATSLRAIPEPLRNRLEVVRIPPYSESDKVVIGHHHLVPEALKTSGLEAGSVTFSDDALLALIQGWTREAGVHELSLQIGRVARRIARRVAGRVAGRNAETVDHERSTSAGRNSRKASRAAGQAGSTRRKSGALPVYVSPMELASLLGAPRFVEEEISWANRVGVAKSLAYSPTGGSVVEVEVTAFPGTGNVQFSGGLGEIVRESVYAVIGCLRAQASELRLPATFPHSLDIHIHMPGASSPKNGPSAGAAIATALVSALQGKAVRGEAGMTGEVTLHGRLLPVGGFREKAIAAYRTGLPTMIIPQGNENEVEALPDDVRNEISWRPVRTLKELLQVVLTDGVA